MLGCVCRQIYFNCRKYFRLGAKGGSIDLSGHIFGNWLEVIETWPFLATKKLIWIISGLYFIFTNFHVTDPILVA